VSHDRRDPLRHVETIGCQVDVERNQRISCADDGRTGRRMRPGRTEVGCPLRTGHLRHEPLELPAPHVFQLPARVSRGRRLVQVHRNPELVCNPRRDAPSEDHAVGQRRSAKGNEGDDIHRADAGMDAAMMAHVDGGDRALEQAEDSLLQRGGLAGDGEDRPVVRRIGRAIEEHHAGDCADARRKGVNDLETRAFAHVRHALDNHRRR
jgi:hypothetical protein